jgi:membrane-associated progesterone receptor component
MSDTTNQPKKERFAPKEPVTLQPPKDDPIDREHLAKCDGMFRHHWIGRTLLLTSH